MVTGCPLLRVVLDLRLDGLFWMVRVNFYVADLTGIASFVHQAFNLL